MSARAPQSVLIVNLKSLPTWHLDLAEGFVAHGVDAGVFLTAPHTLCERIDKSLRARKWFDSAPVLERLVDTCRRGRPDLIIFLGLFVLPRAVVEALETGLDYRPRLSTWVCDCFTEPPFADWVPADHAFYFDTFMEGVLPRYYDDAARTSYLPLAASPRRYRPLDDAGPQSQRLLFVGNVSPDRREFLDAIAPELEVDVHGPNDPSRRSARRRKLDSETINRLYNRHRFVLNVNQRPNTINGANLRVFEATAAGSVLLTEACADLPALFEPGAELVTYDGPADLASTYRELVGDPARCAAIAAAGRRRQLAEHGFEHRAAAMLATLGDAPR
ncbi:MAG: glycosyltransferase family protein [Gammaproteobacteria bacterium]